jgi:urate oxidase
MATGKLIHQHYGKARVRLLKVFRDGERHDIKEVDVSVELEGNFDAVYLNADNSLVVPTDTMKNTVQVLAHAHLGAQLEPFSVTLARHFLTKYAQVTQTKVSVTELEWRRLELDGESHNHSFVSGSSGRWFTRVAASRNDARVESGIEGLRILKSTDSGFAGFPRDEYTTLAETRDRILSTQLTATWLFEKTPVDYTRANESILTAMLKIFALNYSPSVQATLYQMAEAALGSVPEISQITMAMPNLHCLLVDLKAFGRENKNELFVPTDEPHGVIEATIARR